MTVEQARGLLKNEATDMSDEQIQSIIDCFEGIIEVGFQQFERVLLKDFDNEMADKS